MAYVFRCEHCGHGEYTQKGFNSTRTKKKLLCKNCKKSNLVDLVEFENAINDTTSVINVDNNAVEPVDHMIETEEVETQTASWNNPTTVNVTNDTVLTVDLENERKELRDPLTPKTRVININGQQGAFPNFTEAMVESYAKSMNHELTYNDREGVYYLKAKAGSKA